MERDEGVKFVRFPASPQKSESGDALIDRACRDRSRFGRFGNKMRRIPLIFHFSCDILEQDELIDSINRKDFS